MEGVNHLVEAEPSLVVGARGSLGACVGASVQHCPSRSWKRPVLKHPQLTMQELEKELAVSAHWLGEWRWKKLHQNSVGVTALETTMQHCQSLCPTELECATRISSWVLAWFEH